MPWELFEVPDVMDSFTDLAFSEPFNEPVEEEAT
jgi:hypothetical protein